MDWLATFWEANRDAIIVGLVVGLPPTILAVVTLLVTPRPIRQRRKAISRLERLEKEREEFIAKFDNLAGWVAIECVQVAVQICLLLLFAGVLLGLYALDTYVVDIAPPDTWKARDMYIAMAGTFLLSGYFVFDSAVNLFYYARPDWYLKATDRQIRNAQKDKDSLP